MEPADLALRDEMRRQQAAHPEQLGDAMTAALRSPNAMVRTEALELLPPLACDDPVWLWFVTDALVDEKPVVRDAAAMAVARLGLRTEIPRLLAMLDDEDDLVRSSAVDALADLDACDAAPRIQEALSSDPDWLVRGAAARALAQLSGPAIAPVLDERLTQDRNRWVRAQIALALYSVGCHDVLPLVLRKLRSRDVLVRSIIANNIHVVADHSNCDVVAKALSSAIARVARAGWDGLGDLQAALDFVKHLCPPILD